MSSLKRYSVGIPLVFFASVCAWTSLRRRRTRARLRCPRLLRERITAARALEESVRSAAHTDGDGPIQHESSRVHIRLSGTGADGLLRVSLLQTTAESWTLRRVYELYSLFRYAAEDNAFGRVSAKTEEEMCYVNVWNILCAMINYALTPQGSSTEAPQDIAQAVCMCNVIWEFRDMRRFFEPDGSVRSECEDTAIARIDATLLRKARCAVKYDTSDTYACYVFCKTTVQSVSPAQLIPAAALTLGCSALASVLLPSMVVESVSTVAELARKQANCTSQSFVEFVRHEMSSASGDFIAAQILTHVIVEFLRNLEDSLSEGLKALSVSAKRARTVMALSRLDYATGNARTLYLKAWNDLTQSEQYAFYDIYNVFESWKHYLDDVVFTVCFPVEAAVALLAVKLAVFTRNACYRLTAEENYVDAAVESDERAAKGRDAEPQTADKRVIDADAQEPQPSVDQEEGVAGSCVKRGGAPAPHFGVTLLLSLMDGKGHTAPCLIQHIRIPHGPFAFLPQSIHACQLAHTHARTDRLRTYLHTQQLRLRQTLEDGATSDMANCAEQASPAALRSVRETVLQSSMAAVRRSGWDVEERADCAHSGGTGKPTDVVKAGPQKLSVLLELLSEACNFVPPWVSVGASLLCSPKLNTASLAETVSLSDEVMGLCDRATPVTTCQFWRLYQQTSSFETAEFFPAGLDLADGTYNDSWSASYVAAVRNLEAVVSRVPSIDSRRWEDCRHLPTGPWRIEFRDVSFCYPKQQRCALSHISFTVPAGSFLGVIGFSGAGKTTILLLLSRVYKPTEGEIFINDYPIGDYSPRQLRRRIANTWQQENEFRFLSMLSIEANVAMGNLLEANDDAVSASLEAAEARYFVESRGLGRRGVADPSEFSGGELERLCAARSFMKPAESTGVYVFDEFTSALDSVTEKKILSRVMGSGATGQARRTMLMVSHRLSSVRAADEIVVLHNGCIVERGKWDQLVADPETRYFHQLFDSQTVSAYSSGVPVPTSGTSTTQW